jgi:hypothetical protein
MKAYGKVEEQCHSFLTWALDGGDWLTVRPPTAVVPGNSPGTNGTGELLGIRASLDIKEKRKISHPYWDFNFRPSNL